MTHHPHGSTPDATVRYVTSETTDLYDDTQLASIHDLCRRLQAATDPLDAELTTSRMHGRMWELRHRVTRRQPDWSFGLGAPFARQLARVAASSWEESAQLVLLEFRRPRHQSFTIGVLISDAHGGVACAYRLTTTFDDVLELGDPDATSHGMGERFMALDPIEACRRVRSAIDRADRTTSAPIELESAKDYRALTLSRIGPVLEAVERTG